MNISEERIENARIAWGSGSLVANETLARILESDDKFRADVANPTHEIDLNAEPGLPSGVKLKAGDYFLYDDNDLAIDYIKPGCFTPDALEAVARHMRWRSRPKPAPRMGEGDPAYLAAYQKLVSETDLDLDPSLTFGQCDKIARAISAALSSVNNQAKDKA